MDEVARNEVPSLGWTDIGKSWYLDVGPIFGRIRCRASVGVSLSRYVDLMIDQRIKGIGKRQHIAGNFFTTREKYE